jgi:hypothetical protein
MLSVFFYYESSHLLNFPNEHEILIMQNVDEMGHVFDYFVQKIYHKL